MALTICNTGPLYSEPVITATRPNYVFADKYSRQEILTDPVKAAQFADEYLKGEADYFDKTHHPKLGLVYDGFNLDRTTGEAAKIRELSAPSKECLDMGILIKALEGDPRAVAVVGKGDKIAAQVQAVELLTRKLGAFESYAQENPGYGGFLPWYTLGEDKIKPTWDWEGRICGLDNGEWMWTMLVAEKSLRDQGFPELAAAYGKYNQKLQDNVTKVFFDPVAGMCRGDVVVENPKDPNSGFRTGTSGMVHLTGEHGVHEGAMLVHYLTLLGKDLPEGAADKMWDGIKMERVEHSAGTTWEGFWGSAHESWAYLFLPMRDHPAYADLFRIREEIRSHNAVERGYPGFATSAHKPGTVEAYADGAGIEGIGTQPIRNNHMFAVYGVFPMLLECSQQSGPGNIGLAWLHNMLTAPRMQGPLGGGEAGSNDGSAFAAVKTADGTMPNLLGIMGGLERETAEMMEEKGIYEPFLKRLDSEYKESFGDAPLRSSSLLPPSVAVPKDALGDYQLAP